MYCRACDAELPRPTPVVGNCPNCGSPIDLRQPKTYRRRRFPSVGAVVIHLLLTTLVGLVVAGLVSGFQSFPFDGH